MELLCWTLYLKKKTNLTGSQIITWLLFVTPLGQTAYLHYVCNIGGCFGRIGHFLHWLWCTFLKPEFVFITTTNACVLRSVSEEDSGLRLAALIIRFVYEEYSVCKCSRKEESSPRWKKRTNKNPQRFLAANVNHLWLVICDVGSKVRSWIKTPLRHFITL